MSETHPASQSTCISPIEIANVIKLIELASIELEGDRGAARASLSAASCILQLTISRTSTRFQGSAGGLAGWQVNRVRDYIDKNLHRPIHARDLSAIAHRSVAHFSRAFKIAFGEAPHAYVTRRRLEVATHLMLTSADPLSEIALTVGFSDQAHLGRAFRQALGVSPANWRRERQMQISTCA